jgi:hypothetical protein
MILRRHLWFRTPVVAVDPEQAAKYPSHLYKEICDTNMHDLGPGYQIAIFFASAIGRTFRL